MICLPCNLYELSHVFRIQNHKNSREQVLEIDDWQRFEFCYIQCLKQNYRVRSVVQSNVQKYKNPVDVMEELFNGNPKKKYKASA